MRRLNIFYILCIIIILLAAVIRIARGEIAMMYSFNLGEITLKMEGRADVRKWYSGCRLLENFYCQVWGGAAKRPGTYYLSEISDSSNQARIIPFERSTQTNYILELGDETIQFYR